MLVAAVAIIYLGVAELKDADGAPAARRIRWPSASGSAFPSGHAAHAVIFPWLALTLTVRLRPGMAGGSALLALGIAIAALVGLSRVYLRRPLPERRQRRLGARRGRLRRLRGGRHARHPLAAEWLARCPAWSASGLSTTSSAAPG